MSIKTLLTDDGFTFRDINKNGRLDPAEADIAILRLQAPFEPDEGGIVASLFHKGDLNFTDKDLARTLNILQQVPTIVDIYLDRPAVIPEIAEHSAALLANFGASDTALLDVIFGRFSPTGKLPFELPSSMEAVRKQRMFLMIRRIHYFRLGMD